MILFLRIWILRIAFWLAYPFPVRDRVVLASASSSRLRGNLSFVHDELVKRGLTSQIKLLLRQSRGGFLGKLGSLWHGMIAEYYLATSSVFVVDDYFFPMYVATPKDATTVIQTWHASGAFKKIGYSVVGKGFGASEALVRQVDIHSNYDACLIASQSALPHYMEAFGQPREHFVSLGIPRTDDLCSPEARDAIAQEMCEGLELPTGKQVLLYAPTFRGESTHTAEYREHLDLALMRERLGDTHVLLMRLHPAVTGSIKIDETAEDFIVDVSAYGEMNDLLAVADVLITDYSSAIFDFALLGRPMVFLAPDLEEYEAERGFYFDYRTGVPGPVCMATSQVADCIERADWDGDAIREFRDSAFDIADGHASERFVDKLVLPNLKIAGDARLSSEA